MRPVNLLPSDLAKARKPVNRLALAGVAGTSALTMLLAAGSLNARSTVQDRQVTLEGLRAELAATPKPSVEPASDASLAAERSGRVAALTGALSGRVGWDRLLRELSGVLPEDVWLTSMNAKAAPPGTVAVPGLEATGAPFRIDGYTYSYEGVARLLARLQLVPDLTAVKLETSTLTKVGTQPAVQFGISAQVRPTGATS